MCNQRQKQRFWLLVILFAVLLGSLFTGCSTSTPSTPNAPAHSTPATDRGNEIVAEYLKRDASTYRKDRVRFTVTEDDGKTEVFEVDVWRKQADGVTTTLSLIAKPADQAGTGSLVIEEKGKPSVSITYAASRDEFRETGTEKMFFGGLTVQELIGDWDRYDHKFVGEREGQAGKHLEVEGTLKPGQKSVIAKTRVFFDGATYLPVVMHLYDSVGKELRYYSGAEIKTTAGRSYIARIAADNRIYNSRTTIEILTREYPDKLDDTIFTREKLRTSAIR